MSKLTYERMVKLINNTSAEINSEYVEKQRKEVNDLCKAAENSIK